MKRFKIDLSGYLSNPFALYYRKQGLFGRATWERIDIFSTRDAAVAFYQRVKDLPEYLD